MTNSKVPIKTTQQIRPMMRRIIWARIRALLERLDLVRLAESSGRTTELASGALSAALTLPTLILLLCFIITEMCEFFLIIVSLSK